MSFPVWLIVGPVRVHPHTAFELLGYLVAAAVYQSARARTGDHLDSGQRWSLTAAAAIGAVVGSRALFWLEDPAGTLRQLGDAVRLLGGQTVVGGVLGAWIAVELQKRRIGVASRTGDLFAVPAAAGIAVGRIGCFLSGLPDGTYGLATTLPWGVDLGDGLRRHPTALYESLILTLVALMLWRLLPRLRRGETFRLFIVCYLTFRLGVDALKPGVVIALGLTSIQWACVAGLAYYLRQSLRPAVPTEDLPS